MDPRAMLRPKVTGNVQSELVGRPGEKLGSLQLA